jgi:hypothetical protein
MATRGDREEDIWLSDEQLAKLARPTKPTGCMRRCRRAWSRTASTCRFRRPPSSGVSSIASRRSPTRRDRSWASGRRRFLAGAGGMAASFLAMNEVHGQFFSVDRAELYEPDAAAPNAPPTDLFVFDDQLHMVRSSQNGPHVFLAFVQGPTAAAASNFKKNPFQPEGQLDELGRPWAVLDPSAPAFRSRASRCT